MLHHTCILTYPIIYHIICHVYYIFLISNITHIYIYIISYNYFILHISYPILYHIHRYMIYEYHKTSQIILRSITSHPAYHITT